MHTTRYSAPTRSRTYAAWSSSQQVLAASALLALAPLCLAIAVAIKLDSPGPAMFKQRRPGYQGRPITARKFRSMRCGSETATRLGVSNADARITRVGALLRKTKLDEIPQLWNIARGDMKLVGPRPLPGALDAELRAKIPGFTERYSVRPGLTSLAQVCVSDNGLDDELVSDWSRRFETELRYIRHQSFLYDLLVLMLTTGLVLRKVYNSCSSTSRQPTSSGAHTPNSTTTPPRTLSATGPAPATTGTSLSRPSAA